MARMTNRLLQPDIAHTTVTDLAVRGTARLTAAAPLTCEHRRAEAPARLTLSWRRADRGLRARWGSF